MQIKLFGTFRKYGNGEAITLSLDKEISVNSLKKLLIKELTKLDSNFNDHNIVESSAFAVNDEIIADDYLIKESDIVAILPPVCGG